LSTLCPSLKQITRNILFICILLTVLLYPTGTARAASFTAGTSYQLEQAIIAANGNGQADTITLTASITLTGTLTAIQSQIIFEGEGYTLNGNNNYRVLHVNSNGDLTVNDLTIVNGSTSHSPGAGIYNAGILTVNNCTFSNNVVTEGNGGGIANAGYGSSITVNNSTFTANRGIRAGAILNFSDNGIVTINHSTFYNNSATTADGGGLRNNGTMTINNSTFTGNQAEIGGGVANINTLTINNSTFTGNQATTTGGGVMNTGTLTIANSTLSGNTATTTGGGVMNTGALTITNSTLSGNTATTTGGGIHSTGTLTINRNIISGNTANAATNPGEEIYIGISPASAVSNYNVLAYSLLSDSEAYYRFIPTTGSDYNATSDANNKSLAEILTTLANNGGPTQTFALPSGSPAIDRAPNNNCTPPSPTNGIDQRGAARNYDVNGTDTDCDSGAVEFRSPTQNCTLSINTPITIENVTFNFSSLGPGPLGCITVEEMGPGANHLISTGTGPDGETLETGNWWYITGDNIGFTTSISLTYNLADADTRVCKWPGGLGGSGWDCGNSLNTSSVAGVSVTRSGITSFSDWTVGQGVGPTAVTLFNINVGSSLPWVSAGLAIGVLAAGLLLTLWQVKIRKQAHG